MYPGRADMLYPTVIGRFGPIADSCTAASFCSFDHLVGAGEQCGRNFNAELLGGLKIEDQLEFGSLFHRDVAGFRALENLVRESGGTAKHLGKSHAVAH